VGVSATGTSSSEMISTMLLSGVGFSNGCAELALNGPPPLVPISLMASWDAMGANGFTAVLPSSPVEAKPGWKDWMTPWVSRTSATRNERGSRMRTTPRTRSDQKLPMRPPPAPRKPRTRATATARPTPAETKFWTVSPIIWVRLPIVDSPE